MRMVIEINNILFRNPVNNVNYQIKSLLVYIIKQILQILRRIVIQLREIKIDQLINIQAFEDFLKISIILIKSSIYLKGVVALESTIITHGMEYPTNVQTALGVEEEIRSKGAIPATIIIIQGIIRVGLRPEEIEEIGKNKQKYQKCSRRDFAQIIAQKGYGSTTVAATMMIAHMAGIKVFVTGGIGGVHRGAEHTFDISADLVELGQTPVAVICAGAKSILDIPKTLEYLETQGVPVVGYKTKHFPNFFTPDSGLLCSTNSIKFIILYFEYLTVRFELPRYHYFSLIINFLISFNVLILS
ncbi:unnamed protein product [Paramecium sonneborni]|uniref:Pseudouridine-5'-phosphate glycosidase n=1 Tax=Paramecium sonneborni TaxID=65129 RepID=A0A8S1RJ94_9CILI|nr:unnamed protein product [Paramecium sonneborni]